MARIDKIMNTMIRKRAGLLKRLVGAIKYNHVIKRDRQRHLAYMYRQRKSSLVEKEKRYEQWAKTCEIRMQAEESVLRALQKLT